jgi:hypothetical protein
LVVAKPRIKKCGWVHHGPVGYPFVVVVLYFLVIFSLPLLGNDDCCAADDEINTARVASPSPSGRNAMPNQKNKKKKKKKQAQLLLLLLTALQMGRPLQASAHLPCSESRHQK